MSVTKRLVCINCPLGCRLTVELEDKQVIKISGSRCSRGIEYANQESVLPLRVFTALMLTNSGRPLPVRSDKALPKSMLLSCAAELRRYRPSEPIQAGTILIRNILETGCNIIATSSVTQ